MDTDTAFLAGDQDAGAIFLQVGRRKTEVRATPCCGEAHLRNQGLGSASPWLCIRSVCPTLVVASSLSLRDR